MPRKARSTCILHLAARLPVQYSTVRRSRTLYKNVFTPLYACMHVQTYVCIHCCLFQLPPRDLGDKAHKFARASRVNILPFLHSHSLALRYNLEKQTDQITRGDYGNEWRTVTAVGSKVANGTSAFSGDVVTVSCCTAACKGAVLSIQKRRTD